MSANSLFCEMVSGLHATGPMWSLHNHSQLKNQDGKMFKRISMMFQGVYGNMHHQNRNMKNKEQIITMNFLEWAH